MIRATGGCACGATSTRSISRSTASALARSIGRTPNCSLRSSMTRTSPARIWALIRSSLNAVDQASFENKKDSPEAIFVRLTSSAPAWRREFGQPLLARASISLQRELRFALEARQELVGADRLLVAALAPPDIQSARFQLLVADHGHVGDLLELRVADLGLHPLASTVHLDSQVALPVPIGELGDGLPVPVGNWDGGQPGRSQPDGDRARVGLDQVGHEALHRADRGPVDHHRSRHRLLGGHILQAEALRHEEVDLIGREREFAADRVLALDVELRSIEGGLPRLFHKWMAGGAHSRTSGVLGALPYRWLPHPLIADLVAEREPEVKVLDAERPIHLQDQLDHPLELFIELIGPAEDVGIVDGEGAHADQPGDLARLLVAVDRAQLGEAHRQVPEAVRLSLKHADVMRTVHRSELPFLVLNLGRGIHRVVVPFEMPADLVDLETGDI